MYTFELKMTVNSVFLFGLTQKLL